MAALAIARAQPVAGCDVQLVNVRGSPIVGAGVGVGAGARSCGEPSTICRREIFIFMLRGRWLIATELLNVLTALLGIRQHFVGLHPPLFGNQQARSNIGLIGLA